MVGTDQASGARAPQGVAARAWRMHGTKEHAAGCPWTGCRDAGRAGTPIWSCKRAKRCVRLRHSREMVRRSVAPTWSSGGSTYASNGTNRSPVGVRASEIRMLEFGQTLVKC